METLASHARQDGLETGPATDRSRSPRRASARRLVTLLLTAASVALVAAAMTTTAARASDYNFDWDAYCNPDSTISAYTPDLTHYPGWGLAWAARLQRYTSQGWVTYRQTSIRYYEGNNWLQSNNWLGLQTDGVQFTNLARSSYYRVLFAYAWYYNGNPTGAGAQGQPAIHKLSGSGFYYGASGYLITTKSSLPDYCYVP